MSWWLNYQSWDPAERGWIKESNGPFESREAAERFASNAARGGTRMRGLRIEETKRDDDKRVS